MARPECWQSYARCLGWAALGAIVLAHGPVQAQVPAPPAPAAAGPAAPGSVLSDPLFVAAQKRYEALPDAERRAIQEALMWTGDFSGAGSGTYGPLTFRAIQAFQKRSGATPDGFLAPRERAMLEAASGKARGEVKFAVVRDGKAAVQIGVPQAVLTKVSPTRTGTRYASADNTASLETVANTDLGLAAFFEQVKADRPDRKVTYKLLRPDFFVVTADENGQRSYVRFAPAGTGVKGFILSYPVAAAATYDRIAVAVANSFDPGGAGAPPPAVAAGTPGPAAPSPATPAAPAGVFSTGLVVAPGKVLTAAIVEVCAETSIGGRPAKIEKSDKAAGLALLDVPGLKGPSAMPVLGSMPADGLSLLVFSFGPGPGPEGALSVSPAEARRPGGGATLRILAPLQAGGAGSPIFDRGGGLVGVVSSASQQPRLVAGIVPATSYPTASGDALVRFAGLAPAPGSAADQSAGGLARKVRDTIVPITCRR